MTESIADNSSSSSSSSQSSTKFNEREPSLLESKRFSSQRSRVGENVVTMASGLTDLATSSKTLSSCKRMKKSLLEKEKKAREEEEARSIILLLLNTIAALKVFLYYLITLETVVVGSLSIGLTIYWYYEKKDDPTWSAGSMDWILLGFAVVLPLSVSVGLAFRRRENALLQITNFRSFSFQIYVAHAVWDWDKMDENQKAINMEDCLEHSDKVLRQLIAIGDEISRFLTLPTATRIRHRLTERGRREAARTMEVSYSLFESVCTERLLKLSALCEIRKAAGLSGSEASRLRQYERFIGGTLEGLRVVKMYRTPQALLAFAWLFVMCLPPFYAPTFAQVAIDMQSLGFGIIFAVFATVGLSALYESIQVLEDPFVAFVTLDGIDVHEELDVLHWHQLIKARELTFPNAPLYEDDTDNDENNSEKIEEGASDVMVVDEKVVECFSSGVVREGRGSRRQSVFASHWHIDIEEEKDDDAALCSERVPDRRKSFFAPRQTIEDVI